MHEGRPRAREGDVKVTSADVQRVLATVGKEQKEATGGHLTLQGGVAVVEPSLHRLAPPHAPSVSAAAARGAPGPRARAARARRSSGRETTAARAPPPGRRAGMAGGGIPRPPGGF